MNISGIGVVRDPVPCPGKGRNFWSFAVMILVVFSLSGCGSWTDIKRALGMEKTPISDAEIVQLPPLVVPPDYAIRPPSDGSPSDPYPVVASPSDSEVPGSQTLPGIAAPAGAVGTAVAPVPGVPPVVSQPWPGGVPTAYAPSYYLPADPTLTVFNRAFWNYQMSNYGSKQWPVPAPGAYR